MRLGTKKTTINFRGGLDQDMDPGFKYNPFRIWLAHKALEK